MGAKTALLAFADGDLPTALRAAAAREETAHAASETAALLRRVFPAYTVTLLGEATLEETYPPADVTYATVVAGAELLCDRRLVLDRPSALPAHLLRAGVGRRIVMHGMHSVVDWLCFAVWQDGTLVRSLSLSPDRGVVENIGEPMEFERPYWAGEHPVLPVPGWPDQGQYPLPFHPLDLGEEALRTLFGFIVEGAPEPGDIDVDAIALHEFQVSDASGAEQATREAAYRRVMRAMGRPRTLRMGPDGMLRETDPDDAAGR